MDATPMSFLQETKKNQMRWWCYTRLFFLELQSWKCILLRWKHIMLSLFPILIIKEKNFPRVWSPINDSDVGTQSWSKLEVGINIEITATSCSKLMISAIRCQENCTFEEDMKQVFLATSLQRRKKIYTSAGIPYCRYNHLTSQYVSVCCL
jgi:hypothetical protein